MSAVKDLQRQARKLLSLAHRRRNDADTSLAHRSLLSRLIDVFSRVWDLGFTAFGGPAVHFQILYHRFVIGGEGKGQKWIDEQTVRSFFPQFVTVQQW